MLIRFLKSKNRKEHLDLNSSKFFQVSDALRRTLTPAQVCEVGTESKIVPSPEVIPGLEAFANQTECGINIDYSSMQYSMFINSFVEILGGLVFLVTAACIIKDKLKCDRYIAGTSKFQLCFSA